MYWCDKRGDVMVVVGTMVWRKRVWPDNITLKILHVTWCLRFFVTPSVQLDIMCCPQRWFTVLAWLTLPSTANIHIDATFTSARRVLSSYIPNAWVISLYIPNARVGISKENTRGVGISQEKKPYQSEYGATDGWGGMSYSKVPLWHPLCSIWWRTKVKTYYSHVCVRT